MTSTSVVYLLRQTRDLDTDRFGLKPGVHGGFGPMQMHEDNKNWWHAVKKMADLVAAGYDESELTEYYVRNELVAAGFALEAIELACDWIEKAVISKTLYESLTMLQEASDCPRIANPIETLCFSSKVWNQINRCYKRGLLSRDLLERLLECARAVDTRDWEDEEVAKLFAEMLATINPSVSEESFLNMLNQCLPPYYS